MKRYDVKCPICGTENKDLYLEETDGWMICEHCDQKVKVLSFSHGVKVPVYTEKQIVALFGAAR